SPSPFTRSLTGSTFPTAILLRSVERLRQLATFRQAPPPYDRATFTTFASPPPGVRRGQLSETTPPQRTQGTRRFGFPLCLLFSVVESFNTPREDQTCIGYSRRRARLRCSSSAPLRLRRSGPRRPSPALWLTPR